MPRVRHRALGRADAALALVAAGAEQLATLEQVGLRTATTDENGAYQLAGLPPDAIASRSCRATARRPARCRSTSRTRARRAAISCARGQVTGTVVVEAQHADRRRARAAAAGGTASDVLSLQVALEARANRTFSDEQGRFRIAGVAPGQYTLHAAARPPAPPRATTA
jgi:hypothetical protein